MLHKGIALCCLGFFLLVSAVAFGADLRNEDSREYRVVIHTVGTTETTIGSSTTIGAICSKCTLEVKGVGKIKVTESTSVVTIKNGKLSKR